MKFFINSTIRKQTFMSYMYFNGMRSEKEKIWEKCPRIKSTIIRTIKSVILQVIIWKKYNPQTTIPNPVDYRWVVDSDEFIPVLREVMGTPYTIYFYC